MPEVIRYRFFFRGKSYLIPKDYIDDEHPGGADEIMPYVGKDMTDAFEDADHSLDAVELLQEWLEEEYDPNIPSDPTAVASPEQHEATNMDTVSTISSTVTEVTPDTHPPALRLSITSAIKAPADECEPSRRHLLLPSVISAASIVLVATSVALVYLRFTKR